MFFPLELGDVYTKTEKAVDDAFQFMKSKADHIVKVNLSTELGAHIGMEMGVKINSLPQLRF